MARGRKTGGRKAGTPNKQPSPRAIARAQAAATGGLPREYLLREMRNRKNPKPVRMQAAQSLMPYYYPRLNAVMVADAPSVAEPSDLSAIESARAIAFAMAEAAELVRKRKAAEPPAEPLMLPAPAVYREADNRPKAAPNAPSPVDAHGRFIEPPVGPEGVMREGRYPGQHFNSGEQGITRDGGRVFQGQFRAIGRKP